MYKLEPAFEEKAMTHRELSSAWTPCPVSVSKVRNAASLMTSSFSKSKSWLMISLM